MQEKRFEKGEIQRTILGVLGTAGLMSVALLAPNAVRALRFFARNKPRYRSTYYVNESLKRLAKKGWIQFEEHRHVRYVRLTPKGKLELSKYEYGEKSLRQKKWDGKWRLLIFDIRERRRATRDKIRGVITDFGFVRLQDSVWVYPYECEDIVALLKSDCRIGKDALSITAEKIENDGWLRRKFDLHQFSHKTL